MTLLNPSNPSFQPSWAGKISALVEILLEELMLSGDSVAEEDVRDSIIQHTKLYAGWQPLHAQTKSTTPFEIDSDLQLELGEWAIIQPVVRAHLDLIQSKRGDGSAAISGERTGKDPVTANADYMQVLNEMPRRAFQEDVFSI